MLTYSIALPIINYDASMPTTTSAFQGDEAPGDRQDFDSMYIILGPEVTRKLSVVTALAVSGRTLLLPFRGWWGHFKQFSDMRLRK